MDVSQQAWESAVVGAERQDELRLRADDVASISHDLKTPLSIIALDVGVLQERLPPHASGELRRALSRIEQNVCVINRLVHDLLDLSLIDAERLTISTEAVELSCLLLDVVERSTPARDRDRIRVEAAGPIVVIGDAARLERVIANLVSNALKYSTAGTEIVVRLDVVAAGACVSVIDHGPGLRPDEMSAVFDKFHRAPGARGQDGAGLGLYVSRNIIEAHGGRIGVDSVLGQGSRFYFEVPIMRVTAEW